MYKTLVALLFSLCSLTAFTGELAKNAQETQPAQVGEKLVETSTFTAKGKQITTKKILAKKNAVFVFFRGQWCPYCMKQLIGLKALKKDLKKAKAKLYVISAEGPKKSRKLQKRFKNDFTVISDKDASLMKAFGVGFNSSRGVLPVPALYLINQKAEIVFAHYDRNYSKRLSVEEVKTALKKF